MKYEVRCACGKAFAVSAADAGAALPCACGRTVDVPPLHALRAAVGQSSAAPELILQSLLANRELPDTDECGACGRHIDESVSAIVECESAEQRDVKRGPLGCLPIPFVGFILYRTIQEIETRGRNVAFRIPVRCCSACAYNLVGSDLRALLRKQPICAGVLDKYPHARVTHVR